MKFSTSLSLAAAMICVAAQSAFAIDYTQPLQRLNSRIYAGAHARHAQSVKPEMVFGPADLMGDLEAPDGERWFYTGDLTYKTIPARPEEGIAYEDQILQSYDFTIYNAKMEIIGHIKDKMRYEDDEIRAPYIDLSPIVTQKFFNTNDYYEIAVGVATNPGVGMVREHSFIYSLNKDNKDAEGYDQPVLHMPSFIGDVLTISNKLGDEQYIVTTSSESSDYDITDFDEDYTGDPAESPFWKSLLDQKITIKVFGNATNDTDGPLQIGERIIPLVQLQGDQMDAPIVLSTLYDGKPYLMFAQYAEPFYNAYASPWDEDVTMRETNTLEVEIMTQTALGEQLSSFQQTSIPFQKDGTNDRILATYFSIGNLRYANDIDFNPAHYGNNSGKAYFTVTKQNYIAGSDESYISSYYIYKNNGTRYKTIFTDSESTLALSDIPGFEPQQVFVSSTDAYTFNFVDLLSVKKIWSTTNYYNMGEDEEPELLLANLDRTAVDDTYNYVFELRTPTVDENDNDNIRAMWLNADGSFNHIDEINMGQNVLYAKLYLYSDVLHPGFYSKSNNMAYMCLIKRGLPDGSNQEDLLIAEAKCAEYPEGKTLLLCQPNEYGVISNVTPIFGDKPELWVVYVNGGNLTLQDYALPLDPTEDSIFEVKDLQPAASNDCFDLQGRRVANPTRGLYIINGKKIIK